MYKHVHCNVASNSSECQQTGSVWDRESVREQGGVCLAVQTNDWLAERCSWAPSRTLRQPSHASRQRILSGEFMCTHFGYLQSALWNWRRQSPAYTRPLVRLFTIPHHQAPENLWWEHAYAAITILFFASPRNPMPLTPLSEYRHTDRAKRLGRASWRDPSISRRTASVFIPKPPSIDYHSSRDTVCAEPYGRQALVWQLRVHRARS